jgi:signal transduction histidine kinase/CheY-like chemotaxis protein/AraC-like DNA-binding protein
MKIFFTFIIVLIFQSNSFAQKKVDSLKRVWFNKSLHDSTRLESMKSLIADYYLYSKTDSALILANTMLDYTHKKKYIKCEIDFQTIIGEIYFEQNKFDIGIESYTKGLDLAKTVKDSTIYAKKLFELGLLYYNHEDYVNAFKTLQKSQEACRIVGDSLNEGWSIAYQGFIYRDLGDLKEAKKYHLEHLRLSTKYGIKRSISGANGNLGSVYNDMGNIPKSLKHWKEAIKLSKEIGLEEYATVGTGNLVQIYINEKQFSEAIKYLDEYKTVTKQFAVPKYTRNFSLNIHLWQCQIDYGLANYTKALRECEECLKIFNANDWNPNAEILKSLYQVNKKINRNAAALDYFEKYQILIDDEKEEKARTEIQNIVFNNQLVADSIAQTQEKEILNFAHAEDLRKKNREKNLYLIIGLLVLLLVVAYFEVSRRFAAKERKRLKEVNQLKNTLFTNITHEFRTPLTVIKGMTDSIKSNLVNNQDDDLENSLEMIERNSDGLLHLVNEMLDLAKIESGNMELNLVQADIIPFIKYLTQSFYSLAEEKQINFSIHCEIDCLKMDFDSKKLTVIITNLLSNAIKFTAEGGKIIVHINQITKKEKSYLLIKVIDDGIGIAEKELSNIFNRFYQTDASTVRKSGGTGIGLALTKELVDLMHGTIEVQSTLGNGSVFSVKIPVTRKAPLSENIRIANTIPSPVSRKILQTTEQTQDTNSEIPLLLIIEDNMDVAYYLKTCLKNKYETIHAVNGIEGIEMSLEKIPDIIISDVMMPGKDGFEVCATLKSDERTDHIPIIMLTAKASIEDKLKGLSHGADAYLAKPFIKEELFTRLDQLVAVRKKLIAKIQKEGSNILLKKRTKNPKLQYLQKIVKLIQENIGDSNFGSEDLAKKLLVSESQIYRKIKAITGKSTAVYIRSIRLQYAKDLLINTDKTVSEVAYDVGFNDPSYFSRVFKDEFGYSPSDISK